MSRAVSNLVPIGRCSEILSRTMQLTGSARPPRVRVPKGGGKTRPLDIPTAKDRVMRTAVALLLLSVWEADSHPQSNVYRPKRNAQQAMDAIKSALVTGGCTEVIDADLSGCFDSIPHHELLRRVARRVSDGHILTLIKAWLRDLDTGRPTITGNRRGTRKAASSVPCWPTCI